MILIGTTFDFKNGLVNAEIHIDKINKCFRSIFHC